MRTRVAVTTHSPRSLSECRSCARMRNTNGTAALSSVLRMTTATTAKRSPTYHRNTWRRRRSYDEHRTQHTRICAIANALRARHTNTRTRNNRINAFIVAGKSLDTLDLLAVCVQCAAVNTRVYQRNSITQHTQHTRTHTHRPHES